MLSISAAIRRPQGLATGGPSCDVAVKRRGFLTGKPRAFR
jgi:hypothetical protein